MHLPFQGGFVKGHVRVVQYCHLGQKWLLPALNRLKDVHRILKRICTEMESDMRTDMQGHQISDQGWPNETADAGLLLKARAGWCTSTTETSDLPLQGTLLVRLALVSPLSRALIDL